MTELVNYFSNMPTAHRSFLLFGGILFFVLIEFRFPLVNMKYNKTKHALTNLFFTATTIVINFSLAFILYKSAILVTENQIGVLHWFNIKSYLFQAFIGLLLMDFIGAYLTHFVEHKIKFLWKFHTIHHTDFYVDATTANRHHPGESLIRFIFTIIAIIIVGAPIWMFFLYQTLSVLLSQFNHANITLPEKVDVILSYFIVSPNMHKVHHHYKMPYTDSNYGNIFSVWDRLFGTFRTLPSDKIIFGLDTHFNSEVNNVTSLLKIPFK